MARTTLALPLGMLLAALLALGDFSCSGSDETGGAGGTSLVDAGNDAPSAATLRVEPVSASAAVDIAGAPSTPIAFRAYYQVEGEAEAEVTGQAEWSVGNTNLGEISSGGEVTLLGIGGVSAIIASYQGATASASLTVELTGDLFLDGTDAGSKDAFDNAATDPDPANAPAFEYPQDGVVLPANLPPIEAQWTQAADNDQYRLRLTSPSLIDVALYTTSRELLFPTAAWRAISASAPDATISLVVDGIGPGGQLRSSPARTMTVSADGIDESAIYVWQSSTGSFRVLDIVAGTDIPLPTDSPALAQGQPCSGCHRISRDGKRFAYSYNGSSFWFGSLRYDPDQQLFAAQIAPAASARGTYAAFNPLEDTTIPAMLLTVPDLVTPNTAGLVRLVVADPDTNAPIPSNIDSAIQSLDPAAGHATLMPDWSPAGDFVVFVAYDNNANYVRLLGDDVVLGSIVEASVSFDAGSGSFQFGSPEVLVAATPGDNPDTGLNNFLPTVSPDGTAVAFTRAAGWWSIQTQQSLLNLSGQLMLVRRSDHTVFELVRGSNGPGTTWSSTWPQWAPTLGSRYGWLAYGSERPYGHRLTTQSPENAQCALVQGQQQCKQLWVTAIDLQKLGTGTDDPSAAPFWIPGQTLAAQYVSPQWTKAVLPPPR
jgi:hypothetical protein